MATVAVDFDGVLHTYSRGWADRTIYDEPVPGAIDGLRTLMRSYSVYIHTSRSPLPVAGWLSEYGISALPESQGQMHEFWNYRGHVLVTQRKLPAIAYIDDRGIRFESWDQALADLATLAPGHSLVREGWEQREPAQHRTTHSGHGHSQRGALTPSSRDHHRPDDDGEVRAPR